MEVNDMQIDTNTVVSMTEANQNFSKVTRLVDQYGRAVVFKNNAPRYLVLDFAAAEKMSMAPDEDVLAVSKRIMEQYDETELEFFRSIGYGDNCYDSREDFDQFVENGRLTGEEYKGYSYAHSGDGVHYYASQYWQVISNAINEIYP